MNLQVLGLLTLALVGSSFGSNGNHKRSFFIARSPNQPAGDNDEVCGNPADIVFILDSSRSIYGKDFNISKDFVKKLVSEFDIGPEKTEVAALQFAKKTGVEFKFNSANTKDDVMAKVTNIQQSNGGATFTHLALEQARTVLFDPSNGARPGVPKIIILLSDGASTQRGMTLRQAALTKDAGITILAIGIGNVNIAELEQVVTAPSEDNFFYKSSFSELKDVAFQKLVGSQACKVIPTTTSTTPPTTTTTTEATTTTTPAPTVTPIDFVNDEADAEEKCQGKAADVVFVLDKSSSIWRHDFESQLEFVSNVVSTFDIKSGKTQVGAVVFSDNASVVFDVDKYKDNQDVSNAILNVKSDGGITNTHMALELVINRVFTKEYGSRPGVAHICILITDGRSSAHEETLKMAEMVHARGIYVFAIGVGNMTDEEELAQMASSKEYLFEVNGYKALPQIKNILAFKACDVQGDQPACAKDIQANIMFGLYNVGGEHREQVANFIQSFGSALDLESGKAQIGMSESCGMANFPLSEFYAAEELRAAIDDMMSVRIKGLLDNMRKEFDPRGSVNRVSVLFVSGDIPDLKSSQREINRLKSLGKVIVIKVGEVSGQVGELQALASYKNPYVKDETHMMSLSEAFANSQLLKLLCQAQ